jgi:hypothetical protein
MPVEETPAIEGPELRPATAVLEEVDEGGLAQPYDAHMANTAALAPVTRMADPVIRNENLGKLIGREFTTARGERGFHAGNEVAWLTPVAAESREIIASARRTVAALPRR